MTHWKSCEWFINTRKSKVRRLVGLIIQTHQGEKKEEHKTGSKIPNLQIITWNSNVLQKMTVIMKEKLYIY